MTVSLFNANFYRAANSDLKNLTDAQALAHFQNFGLNEGRTFSPFVDLNFYRASNPGLEAAGLKTNKQLFDHLQNNGVAEGRRFSPLVDINFYLTSNPDINQSVKGNREQAFTQLQNNGVAEGRRFSDFFDTGFYLAANNDVKVAVGGDRLKALEHLEINGFKENREFSQFFDINYYRTHNPDLGKAGLQGSKLLEHFELSGLSEGRSFSNAFDVNYYRNTYSDLAAAHLSNQQLYDHFQLSGLAEGRASSQFFNVKYYLANNADLKAAGYKYAQAYDQFVLSGQREGRAGVTNLTPKWTKQLGTSGNDNSNGVTVDSAGNVYVTGYTEGVLTGNNAGGKDAWVAKYDNDGTLKWTKQLGTSGDDISNAIAVDSAGNVYITGATTGALGGTNAGGQDAWVAKYDSNGTSKWTKQLGTSGNDISNGISVDNAGDVYITGATTGALGGTNAGGQDAWVAKYDSNGTSKWTKQLGTSGNEDARSVVADSAGNVYITGTTFGALGGTNAGGGDAWLARYDSNGTLKWTKQLGTSNDEYSYSVALDSTNNIYITGYTDGSLGGTSFGSRDAWIAKYDSSGTLINKKQLGTSGIDVSYGVAVDSNSDVYITGYTTGALGGTNAGKNDTWVAKLQ